MILLSEDGKTLVKIDSWQDIIERPGYIQKVNPDSVTLKQIIGRYHVDPKQPCGISSCGTAHNMGYLVVCDGGIETNIGNKCGKRIFGVDFQTLQKTFTRETNAQRYRENISKVKNQIDGYEKTIGFYRDGDKQGSWCIEQVGWHATRGFEQATLDALHDRANRNDRNIKKAVALSKREREVAEQTGAPADHREDIVAVINGLPALKQYKRLKTLLYSTLGDELERFKALEEDRLDFKDLKRWNNWANMVQKRVNEVKEIIDECHRFLVPTNVQMIRNYKHLL